MEFGLLSALTCILVILIGICFGHSDLDYILFCEVVFYLQLDLCIFAAPSDEKELFCSVSDPSVAIDNSFSSVLEYMVNVFVVDLS